MICFYTVISFSMAIGRQVKQQAHIEPEHTATTEASSSADQKQPSRMQKPPTSKLQPQYELRPGAGAQPSSSPAASEAMPVLPDFTEFDPAKKRTIAFIVEQRQQSSASELKSTTKRAHEEEAAQTSSATCAEATAVRKQLNSVANGRKLLSSVTTTAPLPGPLQPLPHIPARCQRTQFIELGYHDGTTPRPAAAAAAHPSAAAAAAPTFREHSGL
jgi:hypothetical protein